MNHITHLKQTILPLVITFLLFCFGFLSEMRSAPQVIPAPDGCYGGFTTAEGCNALHNLTAGLGNTGIGWYSLFDNSIGSFNTAVGAGTLELNNAASNTAVGAAALFANTSGTENTANGVDALVLNESGSHNTANGAFALLNNIDGEGNSAFGWSALESNVHGQKNTALGFNALANSTAGFNTAVGWNALVDNTSGEGNTAIGDLAGSELTTGDDNLDIGNPGVAGESSTVRIGNSFIHTRAFIGAVRGVTTGNNNAVAVVIDSDGQLGTMSSSARFKKDIKSMDKTSETILALKPVTFHYKTDQTNRPEFGLIAEEVAQVNPDLVVRDKNGEIYTVRHEAVNAMLLNEFLKEHRAFVEEQHKVADQQKEIDTLKAELKEEKALIQKVSDKLELQQSATKVAAHNP